MLYWLSALSDGGDFFNLFRYITFRAGGAFFTALIFGFLFGRPLIDLLRRKQGKGQPIREDGAVSLQQLGVGGHRRLPCGIGLWRAVSTQAWVSGSYMSGRRSR